MALTAKDIFRKVLDEHVEQLDELSNKTLEKYGAAASAQIDALKSKRGPKSAADVATKETRIAGLGKSGKIRSKRYSDEYDAVSKKSHAAFKEAAHKVLTDHGYDLTHPGKASNVYTKHDPETNSLFVAKHHIGQPTTQDSHHYHEGEIKLVSTNGTISNVRNKGGFGMKMELRKNPNLDIVAHHAKEIDDEVNRHHRWSNDSAFGSHLNEEAEQIDELSRIEKATTKLAKEEVETLDEGRGRPRKDGTSAVGADREHIMMQLRKHISLNGANPIEFKDGSKHRISTGEARLAQMIHSGLRTSIEKGNFEKKLDHSHDSFKEALAKKEDAGKGKEKPGITLPALQRINRLKFASGE